MIDGFYIFLQSLIQAITEFLPISSSGHLWLVKHFWQLSYPGLLVEIVLHVASVCAVLVYFWRHRAVHLNTLRTPLLLIWIGVSTMVTGLIGWILSSHVVSFDQTSSLAMNYAFMAGLLLSTRWMRALTEQKKTLHHLELKDAIIVGVVQGLAVFPGISRSGMAIVIMLFLGFTGEAAFTYAFCIAVPTVLAATGFVLIQEWHIVTAVDASWLFSGFMLTLVFSYPILVWVRRLVVLDRFYVFGFYCLGVACLLFAHLLWFAGG